MGKLKYTRSDGFLTTPIKTRHSVKYRLNKRHRKFHSDSIWYYSDDSEKEVGIHKNPYRFNDCDYFDWHKE